MYYTKYNTDGKVSKSESVKFNWLIQWKSTDLTVKNIFFIDSISEN